MPNHTPSPHRFLAPNPPPPQRPKPKPQSGLRNAIHLQTPKATATRQEPDLQFKKLTPAKRFVIPPARHANSVVPPDQEPEKEREACPPQATPRPKPPRKFERVESIEESSQSSLLGTQNELGILPTTEHLPSEPSDLPDTQEEMLFDTLTLHKRRRLSSPSPTTDARPHNPPTHRFKHPTPHAPAPSHFPTTTIQTPRPHFILPPPPTSPAQTSKPLPEIFSPSRKNGRYLPSGLASTMTSWIIEAAGTAAERGSVVYGREREDGVKVRVRVSGAGDGCCTSTSTTGDVEAYPGGVVFVTGTSQSGAYNASRSPLEAPNEHADIRLLLAGTGGARGTASVRVGRGCVVGVRAPVWDVDVGGETWVVGVDWVVL